MNDPGERNHFVFFRLFPAQQRVVKIVPPHTRFATEHLIVLVKARIVTGMTVFIFLQVLPGPHESDIHYIQGRECSDMLSAWIHHAVSVNKTHQVAHIAGNVFETRRNRAAIGELFNIV